MYELLKQEVDSEQAQRNPVERALWAEEANRSAVGTVEDNDGEERPVEVHLSYEIDREEGDSYALRVRLADSGRQATEYYNNKFGADAVFEKIVRQYDLDTDPSDERIDELAVMASDYDFDEEQREALAEGLSAGDASAGEDAEESGGLFG